MSDFGKIPETDPDLHQIIVDQPWRPQVQYSTQEQLIYLRALATRMGLYDAADVLTKLTAEDTNPA